MITKRSSTGPLPVALFILVQLFFLQACASAQEIGSAVAARSSSEIGQLRLREIVVGLDHPWSVAPREDGSFLITERPGRLLYVPAVDSAGDRADVIDVDGVPELYIGGQGGLLDVIGGDGDEVFLSHSIRSGLRTATAVTRGRLEVQRDASGSVTDVSLRDTQRIFEANEPARGGRHFGSRLVIGPDGYLYITVGDRGERENAQNPANHNGSVVRIEQDGSVPPDNPVSVVDPTDGRTRAVAPGLYSWGHRNAQGIALDPLTGTVWLNEHGPRGGDEINIVEAGGNYGWPLVTAGVEYSGRPITDFDRRSGFVSPILEWTPSIAPSGFAFVSSPRFPEWEGDALAGALAGRHLRRVDLDSERQVRSEESLFQGFARIRDVRQGSDGEIYVLSDESPNGGLYRLER